MAITTRDYVFDKVHNEFRPGQYPGEKTESWALPDDIGSEYSKLNSIIETKYTREYLKICAFYNKVFPSLRSSGYITTSYNVPAFTTMDQERGDTGTGISSNYLKQITDQVVARLGTVTYEPKLIADVPTLEYIIYKEEVERLLKKMIRNKKMNRTLTDIFHDAAIVGFSHEFIDPVTHEWVKANDYEVGIFESQFTKGDVKQMLYRNYAFPTASLEPYLALASDEVREVIESDVESKEWVDFKMYFDCIKKRVVVTIGGKSLPDIAYNFETVQMVTFGWDIGFSKVTSTSLFDLLYPTQRELNKINAKIQQLIRLYKGAVPVFNSDVDLSMKAISNGSGEALYVDSSRPVDSLMTVINPTPLDPQLSATKVELKTEMYELAGLQQMSFDMDNFRSAAAVIAANQFKDTVFQAQLGGIVAYVSDRFRMDVYYRSIVDCDNDQVDWKAMYELVNDASIELKPVVIMTPLENETEAEGMEPDYSQIAVSRAVQAIIRGKGSYSNLSYVVDKHQVTAMCANMMVRMAALGIETPDSMQRFMIDAFIDDVKKGKVAL